MKPGRNKTEVTTGLGRNPNAVTGALISNGILYAAIIPRRRDGTVETGAADAQIRLTFDNLKSTLEAAGGTLDDIVQIVVHLTDRFRPDDRDLQRAFQERTVSQSGYDFRGRPCCSVPGMIIELVVQAHLAAAAR